MQGKTVGLVGESGCGKSTVGKLVCKLEEPDLGEIIYKGRDISEFSSKEELAYHCSVQMIFQNPYTSLNPRQRIGRMLREIFKVHQLCGTHEIEQRISETLDSVGLDTESYHKYPFEFSGGQRQRVSIARSLSVNPEIIVCDEPVSALDVSIQAQILKLLKELQNEHNLAYLFISHDLSVVYHICDEVLIMYMGMIMERGPVEQIFNKPSHPYTQALLSAIPIPDPTAKRERIILKGEIPSPTGLPKGCPFYSRCQHRMDICKEKFPPVEELNPKHEVFCWVYSK
jgi:peptide/nickel transport system ATP-binding protein/oligopeptide transport system ATP-binding protein